MMLLHPDEEALGIEKFPPEKAMYLALLRESGIHRQDETGKWGFLSPTSGSSLQATWAEIEEFLNSTEQKARSFSDLDSILTSTPFGLKSGVLPEHDTFPLRYGWLIKTYQLPYPISNRKKEC